ncbi:hypothetical protein AB663_000941 [Microbacterium sp. XT11]|nr:hypothetical protein AB663_000941 [Microbacterium sp. XT11]
MREAAGWIAALSIALVAAAQVAASARGDLLFRDGDSLVVAMLSRSLLSGEPLDWAMSSVLFLPETAVLSAIRAVTGADLGTLLAVNAVIDVLGLYGALRLAAGRRRAHTAPVAFSLTGIGAFALMAATETSASRDALELASLLLTTTYYSATVVAVIAAVGIARRALDACAERRHGAAATAVVALGLVAAASTLTNPLFGAWATVPLGAVMVASCLRRGIDRRRMLTLTAALVGGTASGLLGRIPFAAWIANTGAGYAQPAQWAASLEYYTALLAERVSTPLGVLGTAVVLLLVAFAVLRTLRARSDGERIVAVSAWAVPLLVVVGAVTLGTHAARYLQPAVFAPLLALVSSPGIPRFTASLVRPVPPTGARALVGTASVVLLVAGVLNVPRLADAAHRPDPDLKCVTSWVDESGRTGAGQFWTVRLPKALLSDPAQLVQVDHRLNGYAWLVNRTDFDAGAVTFLVEDAQTVPWELPVAATPEHVIPCGRYRILDFGAQRLPLGPAHS